VTLIAKVFQCITESTWSCPWCWQVFAILTIQFCHW